MFQLSVVARTEFGDFKVLGNDLSPVQPRMYVPDPLTSDASLLVTRVPTNVNFEMDDIEQEWTHQAPFDYIHSRFLAGSISDWPKLIERCYQ